MCLEVVLEIGHDFRDGDVLFLCEMALLDFFPIYSDPFSSEDDGGVEASDSDLSLVFHAGDFDVFLNSKREVVWCDLFFFERVVYAAEQFLEKLKGFGPSEGDSCADFQCRAHVEGRDSLCRSDDLRFSFWDEVFEECFGFF